MTRRLGTFLTVTLTASSACLAFEGASEPHLTG